MTFRQRFLSSSQVSDWHNNSKDSISIPSAPREPLLSISIANSVIGSNSGSGASTASAVCGSVAIGEFILVLAEHVSGGAPGALSVAASGLTFTQIVFSGNNSMAIGAWYAWSPDATSRTISTTYTGSSSGLSNVGLAVYVLRNVHPTTPVTVTGYAGPYKNPASSITLTGITTITSLSMAWVGNTTQDSGATSLSGTGWTQAATRTSPGTMVTGYKQMTVAGPTGDVTVTQPNAYSIGMMFALASA